MLQKVDNEKEIRFIKPLQYGFYLNIYTRVLMIDQAWSQNLTATHSIVCYVLGGLHLLSNREIVSCWEVSSPIKWNDMKYKILTEAKHGDQMVNSAPKSTPMN